MAKFAGIGTKFKREDSAGSDTYVDIANISSITGPGKTRETIETTDLDTLGGYRTFIAGFRDSGTVELKMSFDYNSYKIMNDDFESDTPVNYQIVLPDEGNTTLEFAGLVTDLPLNIVIDDVVSVDVSIKISGKPTVTNTAG
jgi:predicted secreted protein